MTESWLPRRLFARCLAKTETRLWGQTPEIVIVNEELHSVRTAPFLKSNTSLKTTYIPRQEHVTRLTSKPETGLVHIKPHCNLDKTMEVALKLLDTDIQ